MGFTQGENTVRLIYSLVSKSNGVRNTRWEKSNMEPALTIQVKVNEGMK